MSRIFRLLFSERTTIALLLLLIAATAVATFVEDRFTVGVARQYVYHAIWFEMLLLLLAINFLGTLGRYRMYARKKWAGLLFHLAFVLLIIGGGLTRYVGFEGTLHLREGEGTSVMFIPDPYMPPPPEGEHLGIEHGAESIDLPFTIRLDDFVLERYPGSMSPAHYGSQVTITTGEGERISYFITNNQVLDHKGYRLFQSAYDPDERGTEISVNHDMPGTMVTYLGYSLMIAGFLLTLLNPHSRFRKAIRDIGELRKTGKAATIALMVLGFAATTSHGQSRDVQSVAGKGHADRFGRMLVQGYDGRIEPVNTLSMEIIRKIAGRDKFNMEGKGKMTSVQVVLDMLLDPRYWERQEIIVVRNKELRDSLGVEGECASLAGLFDSMGRYRMRTFVERSYRKDESNWNAFDKEVIRLDERVNILIHLMDAGFFRIFPLEGSPDRLWFSPSDSLAFQPLAGDISVMGNLVRQQAETYHGIFSLYIIATREALRSGDYSASDKLLEVIGAIQRKEASPELLPSDRKVSWEINYNKSGLFQRLKAGYGLLGLGLVLLILMKGLRNRSGRWVGIWIKGLTALVLMLFLLHTAGLALRWYLSGHAPWSNGYEALLLAAWGGLLAGLCFVRSSPFPLAMTALLASVLLMTAGHSSYDPQLTNLQPVLQSYWLIFHVAAITVSYGFLGLGFLLGLAYMFLVVFRSRQNPVRMDALSRELTLISEVTLTLGLVLAATGTFLGAVWANESWGRYWGWDAKETWSLIIVLSYTLVLHLRLVKKWKSGYVFHVGAILAFGSVIMTFIGVNYFFSKGLHTYASGSSPSFPIWGWLLLAALALLLGIARYQHFKSKNS